MAMQRKTWLELGIRIRALAFAGALLMLAACSSGGGSVQLAGGQPADPETDDYPIFYVKRYSVPTTQDDLRMLLPTTPSADLFERSTASPSGIETNITATITGTGTANAMPYDIKDVSVSYDGSTVLFAMRGPLTTDIEKKDTTPPMWRIWQYVIATGKLSPVIDPNNDPDPNTVNDVSPAFLPDGRIVFSTTRQIGSQATILNEAILGQFPFVAMDEAFTQDNTIAEPASVLHVMNGDGSDIHQISFNASHDRDPSVLMNGRVMWSRWDDVPGKDGMQLYSAYPDGTNIQLLYGANSHQTGPNGTPSNDATIEFVKAREMQDGRVLALIRPYTSPKSTTAPLGTDFGGDLVIIDTNDYVENTQPTLANATLTGPAQVNATSNDVLTIAGPSPGGRFNSGFPLWDGTGRILVSWSECRLQNIPATTTTTTTTTPTTTPVTYYPCTGTNLANTQLMDAPPVYSVWMFDPAQNTLQPIMQPTDGIMITDVVAAQPRPLPASQPDGTWVSINQQLVTANVGLIDIRSVYDFDGVDTAKPDIATLANGATPAAQRPARFVRIVTATPLPPKTILKISNDAFGAANDMREIIGYAPVQPDGSVVMQVPANMPFQIDVLDANAQRISPPHLAWLQVQAGETLQCNGCHTPAAQQNPAPGQTARSHGRADLFAPAWGGGIAGQPFENSVTTFTPTANQQTMAEAMVATTPALAVPSTDVVYTDIWTNTALPGMPTNPVISDKYASLPPTIPLPTNCPSGVGPWTYNCWIVLNYTENIQPLWDTPRIVTDANGNTIANNTCNQGGCHNSVDANGNPEVPAGQLDLTNTQATDDQFLSYRDLLFSHDEQILNNGVLVDVQVPGPPDPTTGQPTMVPVPVTAPMAAGSAQASTLFFGRFAAGSGDSIHAGILSPSELRLVSEWLDIGAQYFNNPFDPAAEALN